MLGIVREFCDVMSGNFVMILLVMPPLPSGATYLVTMASVCMYGCSLVEIFFTKGFFFDTGFGLIHVQTGKKISTGDTPPPPVKGKIFNTRFGLIHVQTGKKISCKKFFSKMFFCKIFLTPIS